MARRRRPAGRLRDVSSRRGRCGPWRTLGGAYARRLPNEARLACERVALRGSRGSSPDLNGRQSRRSAGLLEPPGGIASWASKSSEAKGLICLRQGAGLGCWVGGPSASRWISYSAARETGMGLCSSCGARRELESRRCWSTSPTAPPGAGSRVRPAWSRRWHPDGGRPAAARLGAD